MSLDVATVWSTVGGSVGITGRIATCVSAALGFTAVSAVARSPTSVACAMRGAIGATAECTIVTPSGPSSRIEMSTGTVTAAVPSIDGFEGRSGARPPIAARMRSVSERRLGGFSPGGETRRM
jgi:hypothetical protein